MIIVKLMGGLGNQMFQYAAGKCLAHLHNTELLFDMEFINRTGTGTHTERPFALNCFSVDVKTATNEQIEPFKKKMEGKVRRTLQRKLPILFNDIYFSETGSGYMKEFYSLPANVYLDGFWQSEKYFLEIEEQLRKDFIFQKELSGANAEIFQKIKTTNSVSLHVRRGDYVNTAHAQGVYSNYGVEYYKKAIELISKNSDNLELFVFSDDIAWCRNNLNLGMNLNYVENNVDDKSYIDMQLMSACKHNIIANSSFSWWGAWLNANPGKMIMVPPKWYNVSYLNDTDLIPNTKNWTRVK